MLISALAIPVSNAAEKSVIIFHAPSVNETYYQPKFTALLDFYQRFVAATHPRDSPIVVADSATMPHLQSRIDSKYLRTGSSRDIWVRDFGAMMTPAGAVKGSYRPNYLSAADAAWIENGFTSAAGSIGLSTAPLNLKIDGGNFVWNRGDRAVVTRRVLADNRGVSEAQLRAIFRDQLGITQLALVPEEAGDTTGHSDGMVAWLAPGVIGLNEYDEPFRSEVVAALRETFAAQEVAIADIPWNPTERYWRDFADGTGVYVNALNTPNAIYVPTYGLSTDDDAIAAFRAHADRPVIPVFVGEEIAIMGGAARCLSCQIWGASADPIPIASEPVQLGEGYRDLRLELGDSVAQVNVTPQPVFHTRSTSAAQAVYAQIRVCRSLDLSDWETVHTFKPTTSSPLSFSEPVGRLQRVFYKLVLELP